MPTFGFLPQTYTKPSLPSRGPTQITDTFLSDFDRAYDLFSQPFQGAPANFMAFLSSELKNMLRNRYNQQVSQQAAMGGIPSLTPLAFLGGVDPYREFLSYSPFQRGEQNILPLVRRVR